MTDDTEGGDHATAGAIDPEAFLTALLHLSREDAAEVREQANEKADEKPSA